MQPIRVPKWSSLNNTLWFFCNVKLISGVNKRKLRSLKLNKQRNKTQQEQGASRATHGNATRTTTTTTVAVTATGAYWDYL